MSGGSGIVRAVCLGGSCAGSTTAGSRHDRQRVDVSPSEVVPVRSAVRVRVLGPVGVAVDGADVLLPAGKPRAVLAMLALAGGRAVRAEELIVGLWGGEAAATAVKTLQVHVSSLRAALRGIGVGVR